MELRHTLVRPLVTEKSTTIHANADAYAFEVAIGANKFDVKRAVEAFYGVNVVNVRTMIVRGKIKRSGAYSGKQKNWKKAIVKLASGQSLELFEA